MHRKLVFFPQSWAKCNVNENFIEQYFMVFGENPFIQTFWMWFHKASVFLHETCDDRSGSKARFRVQINVHFNADVIARKTNWPKTNHHRLSFVVNHRKFGEYFED